MTEVHDLIQQLGNIRRELLSSIGEINDLVFDFGSIIDDLEGDIIDEIPVSLLKQGSQCSIIMRGTEGYPNCPDDNSCLLYIEFEGHCGHANV